MPKVRERNKNMKIRGYVKKVVAAIMTLSLLAIGGCGSKEAETGNVGEESQENVSVETKVEENEVENVDETQKVEENEVENVDETKKVENSSETEEEIIVIDEEITLPRQAAAEGMVLLKNEDNVLPLKKGQTVAILGRGQIDTIKGGGGSGDVNCEHVVSILEGMEKKQNQNKINLYEEFVTGFKEQAGYAPGFKALKASVETADVAIVVITRNSGEGSDRSYNEGDYMLDAKEKKLIEDAIAAGYDDIVVILNVCGVVDTTKLLSYPEVKSILLAWQPGQDAGDAIADILVGDVTPSGKLADTFAKKYSDYPSSKTFSESVDYVNYTEDIFVGYRYFETFDPTYSKVNFCFGHGLSYTTFEFSDIAFREEGDDIIANVKVTNTGDYSGKEVAQLYFSAPQGVLGKPAKELCAFAKTKTLKPGESEVLELRFAISDLSSYDDTGKVQMSAYIMEAGDYNFYLGSSIKLAGEAGICYTYHVDETVVTEQLTKQMAPKLLEKRLLADGTYETVYDDSEIGIAIGTDTVKIEAEAYYGKHCHAEVVFNSDASMCGIKTLTSDSGNRYVDFAIEAPEAGTYSVLLGIGNPGALVQNAVRFYVNGTIQNDAGLELPNTSGLWNIKETDSVTINMEEGLNFVRVEFICGDKFQGLLDYIVLEKGDAITGEPKNEPKAIIEVENTTVQSGIMFADLMENPELMDAFLDQLTVEEMAYLLHGHGESIPHGTGSIGGNAEYGIPSAETSDGPAGINLTTYTTAWPVQTLMACTWNTELLYQVGEAVAAEAESLNVDIWLAPAVNIHRNPLCGRNFEYYSEDPYLSGMMASAIINGVQDNGVGVMIKHFVGNEKETNRGYSDSRVSERALREIYLKPFEIAIKESNPWAIMSSYNKVNGMETAENPSLLTNILREEWKYDGLVSSDWWNDSVQYKELLAGQSLKMKSGDEPGVLGAYKSGILSREIIEENVAHVLELIMKTNAATRITGEACIAVKGDQSTTFRSIESTWKSSEVGMEACQDIDGTFNTTNTYSGQWAVYVVNVEKAGDYNISMRIASNNGSDTIDIYVDNEKVGTFKNTVKTGDWQKWDESDGSLTLSLTEGTHHLKLAFGNGSYNINTITLTPLQ